MAYLYYFDERAIALQEECLKHPELMQVLSQFRNESSSEKLAAIAAYCGVIVDGAYTEEDCNKLAETLTTKLREKRTLILEVSAGATIYLEDK